MLDIRDKVAIARGMAEFLSEQPRRMTSESVAQLVCLALARQRERSGILWEPTLIVTLNDSMANCSTAIRRQGLPRVVSSRPRIGSRLGIPIVPLSELYVKAVEYMRPRTSECRP